MSIAGVVLAAGPSLRMGAPKQLLRDAGGEALVHRTARVLLDGGCAPVYAIVGAAHDDVANALTDLPAHIVLNAEWQEGLASSIRAAVAAAELHQKQTGVVQGRQPGVEAPPALADTAIDALLFATCDMPSVDASHVHALCAAYLGGAVRVASRYGDTIGVPAIVGAREWPVLQDLRGDRGAKSLLLQPDTVTVPLAGGTFDVDTPDDMRVWGGR